VESAGGSRLEAAGRGGRRGRSIGSWARLAGISLLAILALDAGCGREVARPSVLVIIIDTLRADYVGCYGARIGVTPNMDRLAAEGARFSQCVTSVPITFPSISGILTSSYPIYNGVRDNGTFTLDSSLTTMAEAMRDAGYSTAAFVSAYVLVEGTGMEQGFDSFSSEFTGAYELRSTLEPAIARQFAGSQSRGDEITERAVKWLGRSRKPFFLVVHYYDPHTPYDPPVEFRRRWPQNPYLGEVAFTDSQIAPLLDSASRAAGSGNLVTALVADHGEGLGQHKEGQHGIFVYDSTLRVPFILRAPGMVSEDLEVKEQVSTIDLAPTVLELAGVQIPDTWQGGSLAAAIRSGGAAGAGASGSAYANSRPCYIESYRTRFAYNWSELVGVRDGGWKLIRAPRPELYNLVADSTESVNLYTEQPEEVSRLESVLGRMLTDLQGPLADVEPESDLEESKIEKLKTLGYVISTGSRTEGDLPDPKDMIDEYNASYEVAEEVIEARKLMRLGDEEGAKAHLERALDLNPDDSDALNQLGLLLWRQGRIDSSIAALGRSARLAPSSTTARLNLGIAYMRLARYREAAAQFEILASLTPEDPDSRYKYAKALQMAGDVSGALEAYGECLALNPGMTLALYDSAVMLLELGRREEAVARLRKVVEVKPDAEPAGAAKALLERLESAGAQSDFR
jgi:arylsulfatase A-like enzyme/Flp pilus assembly protein TadD